MKAFLFLAILLTVLCVCVSASAATWYVDGSVTESGDGKSWATAFKKIQEGIDAASDGDTVTVQQGTYVENVRFKGKNLVLQSMDPPDPDVVANTVIDGNQGGSVVTFEGTEDDTCVLSGFTIRNGYADIGGGVCGGGAVLRSRAGIRKNVISGNVADRYGAGLAYCDGTVENNSISANSTERYDGGGLFSCNGTIQKNTITGNSAVNAGGALSSCSGTVRFNTIRGNSARSCGGGLSFCSGTVENNLICVNTSEQYDGGGLWMCDGMILNNTITENSARNGGGIYGADGVILNCILWGNTATGSGSQIDGSKIPSFTCIEDWTGGGEGNMSDDPSFVDETGGDYHLLGNSQCINEAENYHWFTWPQRDLDGNCRLVAARVDMGCYEYGASPDSDGDLLSDSDEALLGSDPLMEDSDGDHLRDGLELLRGSNPAAPTPPGTIHVPSDADTIQTSLFLAVDGDNIIVSPGTYRENILSFGRDVILRSSDPQNPDAVAATVIDGGAGGPVISFDGTETEAFLLSGFTITNGMAGGNVNGGGISGGTADNHARAKVAYCIISDNSAGSGGGLAFCDGVIENNTIARNTWTSEFGVGGALYDCDGLIRGNTISDNKGGLHGCDGTIEGNTILENQGSGLTYCMGLIQGNTVSNHTGCGLSNCGGTVEGNIISENSDGGLSSCRGLIRGNMIADNSGNYTGGMSDCEGTIENNVICGNSRAAGYDGGGALNQCVGIIQNNAIIGNSAENGGGLYKCFGTIRSNTIIGNTAYYGGGGIYVCLGTIRNCVVWGNTAWYGEQVFASSEPTYSCIEGWQEGGVGNISDDPLFVDADGPDNDPETYSDNDYRLAPGSPCINAGLNEPWMWEAVDLDGNPRIAQGRVDMGAYEHGSTAFMLLRLQPALGGGTELMWSSEPEASYAVWSRANLSAGPWTLELAIDSQGGVTRWIDPVTSARAKFYRVELK